MQPIRHFLGKFLVQSPLITNKNIRQFGIKNYWQNYRNFNNESYRTKNHNYRIKMLTMATATGATIGAAAFFTKLSGNQQKAQRLDRNEQPMSIGHNELPVENAQLAFAPNVPAPITRRHPVRLRVHMDSVTLSAHQLTRLNKYKVWGFNGTVPGPFIRARVGDVLEVHFTNRDEDGAAHNIDFHAVFGPGGGAPLLFAEQGESKIGQFRLLYPGLYLYHCAAAPIPMHIANGMYGLLLVEPSEGMPPADKEFYVVQSEFYAQPSPDDPHTLEYSYSDGLAESAQFVLFNGKEGALTDAPLRCATGDRVRIFFGNAGPNLWSSFHVIGAIFDKVYRDGGLINEPDQGIASANVPPGGTTVAELCAHVPGTYTLVDHAIHRIDKGAIGYLKAAGAPRPDLYDGSGRPTPCPGCKLHE